MSETVKKTRLDSSGGVLFIKSEFRVEVEPKPSTNTNSESRPRGQNKKRDRKNKRTNSQKQLCFEIANGKQCERSECKFLHDLDEYLETKGPDLGDVCPVVKAFEYCRFGIKCRFSNSHPADMKENDNAKKDVLNVMSREFQKDLRSGKLDTSRSDKFAEIWNEFHGKKGPSDTSNAEPSETSHATKLEKFELDQAKVIALRPREAKKPLDFRNKTYLAPLTTVGNLPFRRICKEFGVDITCAEMSLAGNLLQGMQSEWATVKRHSSEDIFGIQITSNHPLQLSKAIDIIDSHLTVDFVDLNLGCPVEGICARGYGSALMERRAKLREMVLGSVIYPTPITIKLRTGVRDKTLLAHKLVPEFEEWGVQGVTLHGRTKEQRYAREADWGYIKDCGKLITKPFYFGNGDCFSSEDYEKMKEGVDGVMIGRGALIKPWVFTEIKEGKVWDITSTERLEILKKYANYGMEFWGSDSTGVDQTRRFLLEWMSFLHRYVPVGLIEVLPQRMNLRPEKFNGRNELETLMASDKSSDWIKLSEMVLGKCQDGFSFIPKHKSSAYEVTDANG